MGAIAEIHLTEPKCWVRRMIKLARNGELFDPRVLQRGHGVGEMKSCCRLSHAKVAVHRRILIVVCTLTQAKSSLPRWLTIVAVGLSTWHPKASMASSMPRNYIDEILRNRYKRYGVESGQGPEGGLSNESKGLHLVRRDCILCGENYACLATHQPGL